ncbi:unnamed protein product [Durusdinium trenchii]|uniref:Uncharacterized protein n=1 Tax=Durusdinium trenchii TaxID=1381693 RepID=A0ABP0R5Y4_9DINO
MHRNQAQETVSKQRRTCHEVPTAFCPKSITDAKHVSAVKNCVSRSDIVTIPNTCRGSVPSTCRPDAALVASVGGSVPKMADAVEPLAQEVFKQRSLGWNSGGPSGDLKLRNITPGVTRWPDLSLYELAKENENKPVEAKPEAVTSGDTVLEGMLNDLLAALRKEQPQDPLSKEKVDQATAAAEAEVKKTETVPSPTSTTGPLVAAEPDQPKAGYGGPSAGLLAAVQRASEMIKGESS